MTNPFYALERQAAPPSEFRITVKISEAQMACVRRALLPGESATAGILRLAMERVQEVAR